MNEKSTERELSHWLSTYGSLTAKRIFDQYGIPLDGNELLSVVKKPMGLYHQLLLIPLKNVFNGIILEQVQDYQVYAQKLFIDYLLSGEGEKNSELPGANTREDLDAERAKLLAIGEDFLQEDTKHQQLIAESQSDFIKLSQDLKKLIDQTAKELCRQLATQGLTIEVDHARKAIQAALIASPDINEDILSETSAFWKKLAESLDSPREGLFREQRVTLMRQFIDFQQQITRHQSSYTERVNDIKSNFRNVRTEFYNSILRVTELINLLPDYRVNTAQTEENRVSLYFDPQIGEKETDG